MATFKEAFSKALAELGTGQTFTWNGKKYKTDLASGKTQKPKVNPQVTDMAGKGNDKTVAPKASPRPKSRTSAAQNTSNKPVVSSTAPTQPKAPAKGGALKGVTKPVVKGSANMTGTTGSAASAAGNMRVQGRNERALRAGAASVISRGKEVLNKGYTADSAYAKRIAAQKQRTKDIEQALFDQRVANAESDISGASRSVKGKVKKKLVK